MYEVTLEVEADLADSVERHMIGTHIPEIWDTGCFSRIRFDRAGDHTFRTTYEAATQADLERYLRDHAARLRAEFAGRFPTGVAVTRTIWSTVSRWPEPAPHAS